MAIHYYPDSGLNSYAENKMYGFFIYNALVTAQGIATLGFKPRRSYYCHIWLHIAKDTHLLTVLQVPNTAGGYSAAFYLSALIIIYIFSDTSQQVK